MRIKKYAAAFLAATTVLGSLAACGGDKDTVADPTQTPSVTNEAGDDKQGDDTTPEPEPKRDLGGMEIIIGDHWSPEEPAAPTTAQGEAELAYRKQIQADYNFTMKQVAVAGWGDMTDTCTNSIINGDPAAEVFVLDAGFVAKPMSNGLFYDLATLEEFDFTEDKWNQGVLEWMSMGDSIYGMSAGQTEARGGLFWNKDMFEDAGIDPNLPYELQANGEWTWSAFKDLCEKLTRDTNNDGVTDVYAMANFGPDIMKALITSTGTDVVLKKDGKFVNNLGDQNVLDALNFAKELFDAGYEMPKPEDGSWDWAWTTFPDGMYAMQFNEAYQPSSSGRWYDRECEIGFVCFPKPDDYEGGYHTYFQDNVVIIPSCFDAETASKIAFAYNLWTNPTPGYEEVGDWKDQYYSRFDDEEAVDETLELMMSDGVGAYVNLPLVNGLSWNNLGDAWPFTSQTPAERIEEIMNTWDAAIAEANR